VAIQAAPPLPVNQHVELAIDLSETSATIYAGGSVVWSDRTGRAGIRFEGISEASTRQLREWLMVNAFVAYSNHEDQQASRLQLTEDGSLTPDLNDFSARLLALTAVQHELTAVAQNVEEALHLLANRALTFTGATSAAIALVPDESLSALAQDNTGLM